MYSKKIPANEIPKYHHHKNQKTMGIPLSAQNNYISSLLEKNDKFTEMKKNDQEFTSCCKKVTSNLGSIFGSDLRKEAAINLVKRFRHNRSPIQDTEASRADYNRKENNNIPKTVIPSPSINLKESPLVLKSQKKCIIETTDPFEERPVQMNQIKARNRQINQYDFGGFIENNKNDQQISSKPTFGIESSLFSGTNGQGEQFPNASPLRNISPMDKDLKNFFASPIPASPIEYNLKEEACVRIMITGKGITKVRMLQRKIINLEDFTKEIKETFSLLSSIKKEPKKSDDDNTLMVIRDNKKKLSKVFKEDTDLESIMSLRSMFKVNDLVFEKQTFTLDGIQPSRVFNDVIKQAKDAFSMLRTEIIKEKKILVKESNELSVIGIKKEPVPLPEIKRTFTQMIKQERDTFTVLRDNSIKINKDLIEEINSSFSYNGRALEIIRQISNQVKATFSVIRLKEKNVLVKDTNHFTLNSLQCIKVFNKISQEDKDTFTIIKVDPIIKEKEELIKEDNSFSFTPKQTIKVFNKISQEDKDTFTILKIEPIIKEKEDLVKEENCFSLHAKQGIKVFNKILQEDIDTFTIIKVDPIIKEKEDLVKEDNRFSLTPKETIKVFNKISQEENSTFSVLGIEHPIIEKKDFIVEYNNFDLVSIESKVIKKNVFRDLNHQDKDTFSILKIEQPIQEKLELIEETNSFDLIAIESKLLKQNLFTDISQETNDTFTVLKIEPIIKKDIDLVQENNTLELIGSNKQKVFNDLTKEDNNLVTFDGIPREEIILHKPYVYQPMLYTKVIYQQYQLHLTQIKLIQSKYKDYIIKKKCKVINDEITGFNINLLYKGRQYKSISLASHSGFKEINEQLKEITLENNNDHEHYSLVYNKTTKDQYTIDSNDSFIIQQPTIQKTETIESKPLEIISQVQDFYISSIQTNKNYINQKYILAKEITSCILSSVQKDMNKGSNEKPKRITFAEGDYSPFCGIKDNIMKSIKKALTVNFNKEISPNISAKIEEIMKARAALNKEQSIDIENDDNPINRTKTTGGNLGQAIIEEDDEDNPIKKTKTTAVNRNQIKLMNNFLLENDKIIQSLQSKPVTKNKKKPSFRNFDEDFSQSNEIEEANAQKVNENLKKGTALRKKLQSAKGVAGNKEQK